MDKGNLTDKEFRTDSEDDPGSWKRMEKMQEMFTKDPEKIKTKQK